ncbi:MAG: corrinoid protein [Anaerolineales bacterium]|nr:corrinoid protein [Anaerolineales bacterium]
MTENMTTIYNSIIEGAKDETLVSVQQALDAGLDPGKVLNEGMISAMKEVGRLFEEGEFFVPEMLIAARAMQAGLGILRPLLVDSGIEPVGKVVIGTVKGDLHDIGKNLVAMMMEGAGFEVIDLGTDVSPEQFVEAAKAHQPDIIGMSALLTTTMPSMEATIKALQEAGVRKSIKVLVGGAPVTDAFADKIKADGFSPDASRAANLAKSLLT